MLIVPLVYRSIGTTNIFSVPRTRVLSLSFYTGGVDESGEGVQGTRDMDASGGYWSRESSSSVSWSARSVREEVKTKAVAPHVPTSPPTLERVVEEVG